MDDFAITIEIRKTDLTIVHETVVVTAVDSFAAQREAVQAARQQSGVAYAKVSGVLLKVAA